MKRWSFLLLPVIALLLPGCAGYQLGSSKPSHLQGVTKLYVPTFKNDTLEPRIAVLVTNTVIKHIQMGGAYQIVSQDEADATLVGSIENVDRSQFRAVRNNTLRTSELLVRLLVNYKIEDTSGARLHTGRVTADSNVVLDPNFQTSERQAFTDVAERLSQRLVDEISDGW
jgi:hypothetical protein